MERRSSSNLHFINAIKGSLVTKVCNVNSYGKPALVFKKLKDVFEAEGLTSHAHSFLHSSPEFSNNKVKIESQYLPLVDRTLREIEIANDEAVPCSIDGDMGSDSDDYTFGKMTLKELKKNCKAKKRKRANSQCLNHQYSQTKLETEEDDSDMKKPLIRWKLKLSKAKKKCMSSGSRSPKLAVSMECKQDLESESPLQFHVDLLSVVHVKTELAEPEIEGCPSIVSSIDDSFTVSQKDESDVAEVTSEGNPSKVECQSLESNLCREEYQSWELNEVSHDHLVNVEPLSMLLPSCEEVMDVNNQEKWCQQFLHLPTSEFGKEKNIEQSTSPIKDQNADMNVCSRSCILYEFSGLSAINPTVQVPYTVDESIGSGEPCHGGVSFPFQNTSSTDEELIFRNDDKSEGKQPLECRIIGRINDNLNIENHLDLIEDELSSGEEKQPQISASIEAERDSISWNKNFALTSSSSVLVQTPERLLSTRKVVSPTSREQFCLAMNSTRSYGDMELQDRKEDFCNGEQTVNQFSCEESDKHVNVSKSPKVAVAVSRTKFILSPSQIQRKTKHERAFPPKGNLEGPRVSRSLPSVSTGCTSVQGCSESAIAFSRRQMHDIESIAMKLMSELKSMKDIVAEKLLFEAYRNLSLKQDADEVKNAITNATKAEETAKKWLSIMERDCNRFCKIMSLTQKGNAGAASNNTVQRERKRITFADEAGGILCHVKFFENGMTSLNPNSVKQEDEPR